MASIAQNGVQSGVDQLVTDGAVVPDHAQLEEEFIAGLLPRIALREVVHHTLGGAIKPGESLDLAEQRRHDALKGVVIVNDKTEAELLTAEFTRQLREKYRQELASSGKAQELKGLNETHPIPDAPESFPPARVGDIPLLVASHIASERNKHEGNGR